MDLINKDKLVAQSLPLLTIKQLEREVAHQFGAFNRQKLGCSPQKVKCSIFDNYLVVVVEGAATPVEKNIVESGQTEFILAIRQSVNQILKQQLALIIEELVLTQALDLVCELNCKTDRLMALAILSKPPEVRRKSKRSSLRYQKDDLEPSKPSSSEVGMQGRKYLL